MLLWHRWCRRAKLSEALSARLPGVVAATIELYNTIRAELLPTPDKSHYTYNMRDLSKLFQVGVLLDIVHTLKRGLLAHVARLLNGVCLW